MTPTEKHLDRTFAEFLVPKFISNYCDSCHTPLEEESAEFIEHLPSKYLRTEVTRICCIECILEMIQLRKKVRRVDAELNSYSRIRNVSVMTEELVKAHEKGLYYQAWDKVLPWKSVKHI